MFKIFDEVRIKPIDAVGFIDRAEVTPDYPMYRVVYWLNGERKETWVYLREIEEV